MVLIFSAYSFTYPPFFFLRKEETQRKTIKWVTLQEGIGRIRVEESWWKQQLGQPCQVLNFRCYTFKPAKKYCVSFRKFCSSQQRSGVESKWVDFMCTVEQINVCADVWICEMPQWVKVPAIKPDDLSLSSGTHAVEGEKWPLHASFWAPHMHGVYPHIQIT